MEKEEYPEENGVSYDLKKWLLRTISSSFVRNRLLVIISPGCTIGFYTSIHQSICQSINQYTNKSIAGDHLPSLHHPPSDSAHQSINQYANQSINQYTNKSITVDHPRLHHRILHINPSISMPINQSIH
jgi:hypothetical protein